MANKEAVNNTDMEVILAFEAYSQNLFKLIETKKKKGASGLSEELILKIMDDISQGLAYLHQLDPPIIHRDVRVSNILLGNDNNYKLWNFGNWTKKVYEKVQEEDISRLQAEIFNSTQPSHRSPEQLDLQSGMPINEKSWCMVSWCNFIHYDVF